MVPSLFCIWYELGAIGFGDGDVVELARGPCREMSAEGLVLRLSLFGVIGVVRTELAYVSKFELYGGVLKSRFLFILCFWMTRQVSPDLFSFLDFLDGLAV